LIEIFLREDIDGEALLHLNEEKLKQLGVTIGNITKIQLRTVELKNGENTIQSPNKTVDSPKALSPQDEEKLIELGLKKLEKLKGLQNMSSQDRKEKAKKLVVKSALLDSYLNSNFVATRETMVQLLETPESASTSESKMFSSTASEAPTRIDQDADILEMRKMVEQIDIVENMPSGAPIQASRLSVSTEEFLKVKLVIVELDNSATHRSFRKILSPLMDGFNVSMQFGMFHSAIIVGPW
jgi:hypothetical protein